MVVMVDTVGMPGLFGLVGLGASVRAFQSGHQGRSGGAGCSGARTTAEHFDCSGIILSLKIVFDLMCMVWQRFKII
jgi:hypothetical protein